MFCIHPPVKIDHHTTAGTTGHILDLISLDGNGSDFEVQGILQDDPIMSHDDGQS